MQLYYIKSGCRDILPHLVDAMKDNTLYWEDYAEFAGVSDATRFPQEVLSRFAGKRILDIRGGVGKHIAELKGKDLRVNLEISSKRLLWGKKLYPAIHPIQASAYMLPFKSCSFDTVVMIDVIEHLDTPQKAVQEIYRVLEKRGVLILQTPNYPIKRLYDFYKGWKKKKPFADDPTHSSKFGWRSLRAVISKYFAIELLRTRNIFGEKKISTFKRFRKSKIGLILGQKTIIIARKI